MKTFLTRSPIEAAEFIKKGGIVAFPTETVYGLGANIFDEAAIAKIFEAKQRPGNNPLIAHVGEIEQIKIVAADINLAAQRFIDAFFPGALTIVLPKKKEISLIATAGLETIGVRMPRNKLAVDFINACGTPVVAPSANLSGKPSPTNWEAVYEDLNGRIDCILQGETTEIGLESTVLDCTGEIPLILRTGAVSIEDLRKVVSKTGIYQTKEGEKAKSPGLKHKHYSPRAKVFLSIGGVISNDTNTCAYIGLRKPEQKFKIVKICDSIEQYAREVFSFFRHCDRENIKTIYCESVEEKGIGMALMDRLKRASENIRR